MDKGASVPDRALVNEASKESSPQSGFDPSRIQAGDFYVVKEWGGFKAYEAVRVTPKLVKCRRTWMASQHRKADILAFGEEDRMTRLANRLSGHWSAFARKRRDIQHDARDRIGIAQAKFDDKIAAAIATEARSDETRSGSAEGESAGPKDIAQEGGSNA